MNKKFIAFTLAEVLIVMSVIGVIGALTLPNLKKSYGTNANIAKIKSAYTKIDSALQQMDMNKTLVQTSINSNEKRSLALLNEMANFLKLSTNCGKQTNTNYCFSKSQVVDPSGYITNALSPNSRGGDCATAVLNDGTEFAVCLTSNTADLDNNTQNESRGLIFIDVDGAQKGANTRGQDIFVFQIGEEGLELIQKNGYNPSTNTYKLEDSIFADAN